VLPQVWAAGVVALLACGLTGCAELANQVPSLASSDVAKNAAACHTVADGWNALAGVISSGNLETAPTALADFPGRVDSALQSATDTPLRQALADLQREVTSVASGATPDLGALVATSAAISARCAIAGTPVTLTVPKLN
jgi:hypothetical protein